MSARPVRSSPVAALGALVAVLAIATLARTRTPSEPVFEGRPVTAEGPLDLNRATAAELETLPRVGPSLAARIIEHRESHGPFENLAALDEVRGVGPAVLRALEGRVVVTMPESDAGLPPDGLPR